jgi:hypothetical protein
MRSAPVDEVEEAVGRAGGSGRIERRALDGTGGPGLAGVVEVRADAQDDRRLLRGGDALRAQDVGVELRAVGLGDVGLAPVGVGRDGGGPRGGGAGGEESERAGDGRGGVA